MNKALSVKSVIKNGCIFIVLIAISMYFLLRGKNIGDIIKAFHSANPIYIIGAVCCMCVFIICEAINIGRTLKLFGYSYGFFTFLKYALAGFFFSSVTPSATGGQPMQLYYMNRDNITLSHATLSLLIELASFQFISISLALIAFFTNIHLFMQLNTVMRYLLATGVILNGIILTMILITIFSKNLANKIVCFVVNILKRMKIVKNQTIEQKVTEQIEQYQMSALYIKEHKTAILRTVLTSLVQITSLHSIPFLVYQSFGLSGYSFFTIFALQAVLFITVSALPLPGGVGASESGFVILFTALFPASLLNSAMMLSRGISFYLFLLISGIAVVFIHFGKMKA